MVRPRHYQVFIAGAAIALGLWILTFRLWNWDTDHKVYLFGGEISPIPDYELGDETMELPYTDSDELEADLDMTSSEDITEEMSTILSAPSTAPMAD